MRDAEEFADLGVFEKDNPNLIKLFSFHTSTISHTVYHYYIDLHPVTEKEFCRIDQNTHSHKYRAYYYNKSNIIADVMWFTNECKVEPKELNLKLFNLT